MAINEQKQKYFQDWNLFCKAQVKKYLESPASQIRNLTDPFVIEEQIKEHFFNTLFGVAEKIAQLNQKRIQTSKENDDYLNYQIGLNVGIHYYFKLDKHIKFILIEEKIL